MGSPKHTMKLLFSLLVCTILSQTLCSVIPVRNIVKREALPEASPHRPYRRRYRPTSHLPSNHYNTHYNTGFSDGYHTASNNRPGINVGGILPLKAAAVIVAVKGFKLAAALG